jgi:hypothetical protein
MVKVKDFVQERIAELEESLEPLKVQQNKIVEQILEIEKELGELRHIAKRLGMVKGIRKLGVTRRKKSPVTIKQAVLEVLTGKSEGMLALDILAEINQRFQLGIVRPTLSPQLTRLKRDGSVVNNGGYWSLASPRPIHKYI